MPMMLGVKPWKMLPSLLFWPNAKADGSWTRNTVLLLTVLTSIAPSKGMERRACGLNPSSWFTSVRSAQSEGFVPQLGSGTFTRKPVRCCESNTVKRSLGNGDVVVDCRLKSGCVCASASAGVRSAIATRQIMARRINEYFSLRVVCMAVENLQGELQRVTKTLDL